MAEVNNPIKTSDLIQNDGTIDKLIADLEKLRDKYVKSMDEIRKKGERAGSDPSKAERLHRTAEAGRAAIRRRSRPDVPRLQGNEEGSRRA